MQSGDIFSGFDRYLNPFKNVLTEDRSLNPVPNMMDHFTVSINRSLTLSRLKPPRMGAATFAKWIYDSPVRCQAVRISYETYHSLRSNKTDTAKKGDIGDLSHVEILPYVDFMVLERRMRTYLRQACKKIGLDFDKKICTDVRDLFS